VFTGNTLLRKFARRKALSLLVMLSVATGAMGMALCPHMLGVEGSCSTQTNLSLHAQPVRQAEVVESHHCMHSDATGASTDEMATANVEDEIDALAAPTTLSHDQLIADYSANKGEAVVPADKDCAHCVMHSQDVTATSSRNVVQPRNSHEQAAVEGPVKGVTPLAALPILALHDHDPPGASGARHLLINVFRI
jgi:hypothetical protein